MEDWSDDASTAYRPRLTDLVGFAGLGGMSCTPVFFEDLAGLSDHPVCVTDPTLFGEEYRQSRLGLLHRFCQEVQESNLQVPAVVSVSSFPAAWVWQRVYSSRVAWAKHPGLKGSKI